MGIALETSRGPLWRAVFSGLESGVCENGEEAVNEVTGKGAG